MRTNMKLLLFFSLVIVNNSLFSKALFSSQCPTLNTETMNALTTSKEGKTTDPRTGAPLERVSKYSSRAAFSRGTPAIFKSSSPKEQKSYEGASVSLDGKLVNYESIKNNKEIYCAYTISPLGTKQTVIVKMNNPGSSAADYALPPLPAIQGQGDNYNQPLLRSRSPSQTGLSPSQNADSVVSDTIPLSRNFSRTALPAPNSEPIGANSLPDPVEQKQNYDPARSTPTGAPAIQGKPQLNSEPTLVPPSNQDEADLLMLKAQKINIAEEPKSIQNNNESSSSNFTRRRAQARNLSFEARRKPLQANFSSLNAPNDLGNDSPSVEPSINDENAIPLENFTSNPTRAGSLSSEVNSKPFNRTLSQLPDSAARQTSLPPLEASANEEQAFAPPQALTPSPSRRQSVSNQDAKVDMPPAYGNPALTSTSDVQHDNFPPSVADDNSASLSTQAETPVSPSEEGILPLQGIPPAPPPPSPRAISSKPLPSQGNPPPAPLFTGYTPKVNKEPTQVTAGIQQNEGQIPDNQAQKPSAGHSNSYLEEIQKGVRLKKVDPTQNKKNSTLSLEQQKVLNRRKDIEGNDKDDEDWGDENEGNGAPPNEDINSKSNNDFSYGDASQNSNSESVEPQGAIINAASDGRAPSDNKGADARDMTDNSFVSYGNPNIQEVNAQGMTNSLQTSLPVIPPASLKNHSTPAPAKTIFAPPPPPPLPPLQPNALNQKPSLPSSLSPAEQDPRKKAPFLPSGKIASQQSSSNMMDAITGGNYQLNKVAPPPENKPKAQNSTGFNMDMVNKLRDSGEFDDIDKKDEAEDDSEWD